MSPKYRKLPKKWNTATGGGGRNLAATHNYFGNRKGGKLPWILWVYWLDSKIEFVITHHNNGRVKHCFRRVDGLVAPDDDTSDSSDGQSDIPTKGESKQAQIPTY